MTTDSASLSSQVKETETPLLAQKKDKWGYVNSKGRFIIKPRFQEAYEFDSGHAIVKLDGKYGIINTIGDFWYSPVYDKITKEHFGSNYYYKLYKDGKIGLFNPIFYAIGEPFSDGEELPYDDITPCTQLNNEIVFIGRAHNNVFFFGNTVQQRGDIKTLKFDDIISRGDVFCTRVGSLYGYISQDFSFICKPRFSKVVPLLFNIEYTKFFDKGVAYVLTTKQCFTWDEYDDFLFKRLSSKEYFSSDELPSWMKHHVKRVEEQVDEKEIYKKAYNRVREMGVFGNRTSFKMDGGYVEMKYFSETVGDNEIRHPISYNAFSHDQVASIFHYYNTEDEQLRISSYVKSGDDKVTRYSKDVSLSTIKQAICLYESELKDAYIVPLSFGVLENGNYLLHINVLYNFRTEVFAVDSPTYLNVFGQPWMINDGLHHRRRHNSFDVGIVLNKTDLSVVAYIRPKIENSIFLIDKKGGFFCCHEAVLAIKQSPLNYYDDNGKLRWSFTPEEGDAFKWLDGTDSCWYLVGKTTSRGVLGGDNALFLTMDNNGEAVEYSVVKDSNPYDDVKVVNNEWLYTLIKGSYYKRILNVRKKEYAPRVESVRWGDTTIFACGVYETKDGWYISPVMPNERPSRRGEWTVYPFKNHYALVCRNQEEMYVTEGGEIVSSPSY